MIDRLKNYKVLFLVSVAVLSLVFWKYTKELSLQLYKLYSPTFVFSVSTLVVSLLIPIAIMILGAKKSEDVNEDRWIQLVLKKRIVHFKNIFNYIITIILSLVVMQVFPQITLLLLMIVSTSLISLLQIIKKYILD